MTYLVQFTHPGAEHGPDSDNPRHKSWNTGGHRRKFMQCLGDYVGPNNKLTHNESLLFWGEWEPPSDVEPLPPSANDFQPKLLHYPYVPSEIPTGRSSTCAPPLKSCQAICGKDGTSLQNTDPFVFEDCFKYFVCKQAKLEFRKATGMTKLDKGSIIVFGSTAGKIRTDALFQLDTVFVVADWIEYDPAKPESLQNDPRVSELYYQLVISKALPQGKPNSIKLRLYLGATFGNPIDGMYSFSPARVCGNAPNGFPRVRLQNEVFLTNNLNSAPRFFPSPPLPPLTPEEQYAYWNSIRNESRKQGCVEGVRFSCLTENERHASSGIFH